jgi:hypothetical protein
VINPDLIYLVFSPNNTFRVDRHLTGDERLSGRSSTVPKRPSPVYRLHASLSYHIDDPLLLESTEVQMRDLIALHMARSFTANSRTCRKHTVAKCATLAICLYEYLIAEECQSPGKYVHHEYEPLTGQEYATQG